MKLAIGADHRGLEVCQHVVKRLRDEGHETVVYGCAAGESCDYPDNAWLVGRAVADGKVDRGLLFCGSGIGMCIAANKIKGVRAALVHDDLAAEMSRSHNDSNVLCVSADMLGVRLIDKILERWLHTAFEGGRHARRVRKIEAIERGEDPTQVRE